MESKKRRTMLSADKDVSSKIKTSAIQQQREEENGFIHKSKTLLEDVDVDITTEQNLPPSPAPSSPQPSSDDDSDTTPTSDDSVHEEQSSTTAENNPSDFKPPSSLDTVRTSSEGTRPRHSQVPEHGTAAYYVWKRGKQKLAKGRPFFSLTPRCERKGRSVAETGSVSKREHRHVSVRDIQQLIIYALVGEKNGVIPRWCMLKRWSKVNKVVVVAMNGVKRKLIKSHPDALINLKTMFKWKIPIQYPTSSNLVQELLFTKLTKTTLKKRKLEGVVLPIVQPDPPVEESVGSKVGRTHYILKHRELINHNYITPENADRRHCNFVSTGCTGPVTDVSPLFAIDCEMCMTAEAMELTRFSIIDESYNIILDTFVKPHNPILDYVTRFSGITAKHLNDVTTTVQDIQKKLKEILPNDAILVGQSLDNDLKALKMFHPFVIDTSFLFHRQQTTYKTSLKRLSAQLLGKIIQTGSKGHDSVEDSVTTMELVHLKLRNGPDFCLTGSLRPPNNTESVFDFIHKENKTGCVVDICRRVKLFHKGTTNVIPSTNDRETVSKGLNAMSNSNLTFLHLNSFDIVQQGYSHDPVIVEDTLRRMDERVGDIVSSLPLNSLVIVLCVKSTSRTRILKQCHSGVCYISLTGTRTQIRPDRKR